MQSRKVDRRTSPSEGLLSVDDAAAHLGISKSWLYQSDVPFAKLGRRRLYRPEDLDGYVRARVSHHVGSGER
jgi:hypothetical protein